MLIGGFFCFYSFGGQIVADQVKSLDWRLRKAEKKGTVAKTVVEEVVPPFLLLIATRSDRGAALAENPFLKRRYTGSTFSEGRRRP